MARWTGGHRSALVPAPTASDGEPKNPAKKRQTTNDAKLSEKPAPSVKRAARGKEMMYTDFRPKDSERGAARTGPNPKP